MSSVSNTTAFYQFFRDRETRAGAQQAGSGEARPVVPGAPAGQGEEAQADAATGAAVRGPAQVRSRLDALIAGQVATGKLPGEQVGALKQALSQGAPVPAEAGAPAEAASADGPAPSADPGTSTAGAGTYSPLDVLATFIQNLQSDQGRSPGYGSDGSAPARTGGSRLLDFNT